MRVIYVVRGAQLLLTIRALWLLYSVSQFCEHAEHDLSACSGLKGAPLVADDQKEEYRQVQSNLSASNRTKNDSTSVVNDVHHDDNVTLQKPDFVPILATVDSLIDQVAAETKNESATPQLESTPSSPQAVAETTTHAAPTTTSHPDPSTPEAATTTGAAAAASDAHPLPTDSALHDPHLQTEETLRRSKRDAASTEQPQLVAEKTKDATAATAAAAAPKVEEQQYDRLQRDSVKKDLTAQYEPNVNTSSAAPPQQQQHAEVEDASSDVPLAAHDLSAGHGRFALEHSTAKLLEIRCLGVTTDDYFGKALSPFSAHLKGLVFVGPTLVVIGIYLVCTILRTRLVADKPGEFTSTLGCIFHMGMWFVVGISMYFIANHWTENWIAVSAHTFAPQFPCAWRSLLLLSSLMMMSISVETWFHHTLYHDIVFERAYGRYEVVESSDATTPASGAGTFAARSASVY